MKSFKNRIRDSKKRMSAQAQSLLRPLMAKTGMRLRLGPRIRLLNSKASKNPKRTFAFVFSSLLLIFLADLSLTLFHPVKAASPKMDIASVDTVFSGFRTIQDNKEIHRSRISEMALDGNEIRHRLDSLIALPNKGKADSIEIRREYMRLERIVRTLEASVE